MVLIRFVITYFQMNIFEHFTSQSMNSANALNVNTFIRTSHHLKITLYQFDTVIRFFSNAHTRTVFFVLALQATIVPAITNIAGWDAVPTVTLKVPGIRAI